MRITLVNALPSMVILVSITQVVQICCPRKHKATVHLPRWKQIYSVVGVLQAGVDNIALVDNIVRPLHRLVLVLVALHALHALHALAHRIHVAADGRLHVVALCRHSLFLSVFVGYKSISIF